MLDFAELRTLSRALRSARVLTVYLDGTVTDPAQRRVWRVQLDRSIHDLRAWLAGSSRAERAEFEKSVRLLEDELRGLTGNVGSPGWVTFITADRVHETSPLPVLMPTLAVWSTGMGVAPYIRALKETRSVAVALADSSLVKIYRYRSGLIEPIETLRAPRLEMVPLHMGDAPRMGFHTGTRGEAGRDRAQRGSLERTGRMLADAIERLLRVAGPEGWIVTGGIPEVSRRLAASLASRAPDRVSNVDSLDIHASQAALAEVSRKAASELRNAMDASRIAEIRDRGAAIGLGSLGPAATREALQHYRVGELYVTHRYLENHAAAAEEAVRAAMDQGAVVEEVSGAAAEQLDALGGMAARLRYRGAQERTTA